MALDTANVQIRRSFIVPLVTKGISYLSYFSMYDLCRRLIWKHNELLPFWFAEIYVISWLAFICIGFICLKSTTSAFIALVFLACYRLLDIIHGFARIVFIERQQRTDKDGEYILVRDVGRWVILVFINTTEIHCCPVNYSINSNG